jgi:hypothetical protein
MGIGLSWRLFFLLFQVPVILVCFIPDIYFKDGVKWFIFAAQLYFLKYK